MAVEEKTGARALMTVCEKILRDFKYELPGTSVSELTIDAALIDRHDETLERYRALARQPDPAKTREEAALFCQALEEKSGVRVAFDDDALLSIGKLAAGQGRSVLQVCGDLFHDYEYGLKLLRKNSGQAELALPAAAIDDPDQYLSQLVVASCRD